MDTPLNAPDEPDGPGISDNGVALEGFKTLEEVRGDFAHMLEDVFALHDFNVFKCGGARNGVAGIGITVGKENVFLPGAADGIDDAIGNNARSEGLISRGKPFGASDDIGRDAENLLRREPMPESSERTDDFIGDVQHVIFAADFERFPVVVRRRDDNSTGSEHRLSDKSAHVLRTGFENGVLKIFDFCIAPLLKARAFGAQVRINIGEDAHERAVDVEPAFVALFSRNACRQEG